MQNNALTIPPLSTDGSGQPRAAAVVEPRPDQRLARRYCFNDADMDLFFMAALGWGPTGGLDIGQAFHVASSITDGDPDSWVQAFSKYGATLDTQANVWKARGWKQQAGEMHLKAFASLVNRLIRTTRLTKKPSPQRCTSSKSMPCSFKYRTGIISFRVSF
jgi:hypothetical protein